MKEKGLSKASMTVEASLILPIFIYFFVVFLYFFQVLLVQEYLQEAITDIGIKIAKESYIYQKMNTGNESFSEDKDNKIDLYDFGALEEIKDRVIDTAYLMLKFKNYVDVDYINNSCIENGLLGINFLSSSVLDSDDYINIDIKYKIKQPIKIFKLDDFAINQKIKLRAWTGFWVNNINNDEEVNDDDIVYITRTGTVYHLNRDCSHIKLSIRTVTQITDQLRNNSGGKYYPCEICNKDNKKDKEDDIFYITSDGTRYHVFIKCSGIKRDVLQINIKDVEGRRVCSRCKKEDG